MTPADNPKEAQTPIEQQACEVPLTEQLRSIPVDYRTCRAIQWSESGAETGHQLIPVGYMMHRSADRIDQLERELAEATEVVIGYEGRDLQLPVRASRTALGLIEDLKREFAEAQAQTPSVAFDAEKFYTDFRTRIWGADWQDHDAATCHEHVEALEETVAAALRAQRRPAPAPEVGELVRRLLQDAEWFSVPPSHDEHTEFWETRDLLREAAAALSRSAQGPEVGVSGWESVELAEWSRQVRLIIRGIDGQAERILGPISADWKAGDEEIVVGYRLKTGLWHRLLGLLSSCPASEGIYIHDSL